MRNVFSLIIHTILRFTGITKKILLPVLLCAITIWIALDTYVISPLPYPAAVTVTNVGTIQTTIVLATAKPMRVCVLLDTLIPLRLSVSCGNSTGQVHTITDAQFSQPLAFVAGQSMNITVVPYAK